MRALFFIFWLFMAGLADAQSGEARRITDSGVIEIVLNTGERLTVRPAGIELADDAEAREVMDLALSAGPVELIPARRPITDRFGNLIGDLQLANGQALTDYLVTTGFAIAYSWPETREAAARLMSLEGEARSRQAGLWSDGRLLVRSADPNQLALHLETVQIIQGRVISIGDTRERLYLNFGFDYRSDFTVSIDRSDIDAFSDAGINLTALEGHQIRVRGWLRAVNGPAISIDHPERLEVLTLLQD